MSSRESALAALIDSVPVDGEFPPTLVLPEYIHNRTLASVAQTGNDGRERSLHFHHRFGRWSGGLAMRGPHAELDDEGNFVGAQGNRLHHLMTVINRPQVHVHTHPTFVSNFFKAREALSPEAEILLADLNQSMGTIQARVPSGSDVQGTLEMPWASVAHIIGAESGSFLWMHKDVHSPHNSFFARPGKSAEHAKAMGQLADKSQGTVIRFGDEKALMNVGAKLDKKTTAQQLLEARAWALSSRYVCYASDDVENPVLKIVVPGENVKKQEVAL